MKLVSTNPGRNFEVVGEVEISSDEEIKKKIDSAHKAKEPWKEIGTAKRVELLKPIYEDCVKRKDSKSHKQRDGNTIEGMP